MSRMQEEQIAILQLQLNSARDFIAGLERQVGLLRECIAALVVRTIAYDEETGRPIMPFATVVTSDEFLNLAHMPPGSYLDVRAIVRPPSILTPTPAAPAPSDIVLELVVPAIEAAGGGN